MKEFIIFRKKLRSNNLSIITKGKENNLDFYYLILTSANKRLFDKYNGVISNYDDNFLRD